MSGGSLNYLCYADVEALFSGKHDEDLQIARNELQRMKGGGLAARRIAMLEDLLLGYRLKIAEWMSDDLRDLLHALEWKRSCDISEEQFQAALDKYRELNKRRKG